MNSDNKPAPGILITALESLRDFYRWRLSLKSTLKGRLMTFGVQFVLGVFMAQVLRVAFGAPNNLISYALTLGMGIGVGIAGPLSFFLSSLLFWIVIGTLSGLALDVWPYLPSWWRDAQAQWLSGATIPAYIVGGGVVLVVAWVLSSLGVAKLRDNFMPRLLSALVVKFGAPVSSETADEARNRAMPTDAEAERMIRSAYDEESGSVIRPMPKRVDVVLEKEPVAEITDDLLTDNFLMESVSGTSDIEGLASGESISAATRLGKESAQQPSSPVPTPAVSSPGASTSKHESASSSVDGQGKFRLNSLLTGYQLAMESPDQYEAINVFVRDYSALIEKLSLKDLDYIKSLPDGDGLHNLISGMTKALPITTVSSAGKPDEMFGEIADPVSQAIEAATPLPTTPEAGNDAATGSETSVPNPDAQADTPVASGEKASGRSMARMLASRTAKAMPASPASKKSGEALEDGIATKVEPDTSSASVSEESERSDSAALMARFGIAPPTILGEERDTILKAALEGLPVDGIEDLPALEAEPEPKQSGRRFGEKPSDAPVANRSASGDVTEEKPSVEESALLAEDEAHLLSEGVVAEPFVPETAIVPVEPVQDEDLPEEMEEELVEVIATDGTTRFVLQRDVALVTAKEKVSSPLDELPEFASDDDYYDLGLIPYKPVIDNNDVKPSKDFK